MSEKLVVYFSASGTTKRVAKKVAEAIEADIYEIKPAVEYTKADLNWMDKNSRSSIEMNNPNSRPDIVGTALEMDKYDVVFLGFPIWWYVAPTIINTFLESYDFNGKMIIPFATSGGSGMGKINEKLIPSCPGATLVQGKVLNGELDMKELKEWADYEKS